MTLQAAVISALVGDQETLQVLESCSTVFFFWKLVQFFSSSTSNRNTMYRIAYKFCIVLLSALICVSLIKSDGLNVQANDSFALNTSVASEELPFFGDFLVQYYNQSTAKTE